MHIKMPRRSRAWKHRDGVGLASALILRACWLSMWSLHVTWRYEVLVMATHLGCPSFMFSYRRDRMHLENFRMARVPLLRAWFSKARRLHEVYHRALDKSGRIDRNFGIGFFFGRLFGTMAKRNGQFNKNGYQFATRRHLSNTGRGEVWTRFTARFRT
jgi:hypothetical protein